MNGEFSDFTFISIAYLCIKEANMDLPTPVFPRIKQFIPFGGYKIAALACSIALFKDILFSDRRSSWDFTLFFLLSAKKNKTGLPLDLHNLPSLHNSFSS